MTVMLIFAHLKSPHGQFSLPRAYPSSASCQHTQSGKMRFFVAGPVAAIQRIWVGLPQRKGRQSEFNRQLGVTGNKSSAKSK
jgi:hypothetical protein